MWADTSELNISHWWNQGLDAPAARTSQGPHNALLLNDDVILASDVVEREWPARGRGGGSLAVPGVEREHLYLTRP